MGERLRQHHVRVELVEVGPIEEFDDIQPQALCPEVGDFRIDLCSQGIEASDDRRVDLFDLLLYASGAPELNALLRVSAGGFEIA